MAAPGFKEARFPLEVSAWMVGGPEWKTDIIAVDSGGEFRGQVWEFPLHRYDASNGLQDVANAQATKRFHMRMRGSAYAFRVLDPLDYECLIGEGQLVATDTAHVYQLVKSYTEDGDIFLRTIAKPIPGSVIVLNGATDVTEDLDFTSGLLTLTGVTDLTTLSWTGLFDVPVRFEVDWLQLGRDPAGLLNWNNAGIREVRDLGTSVGTPPTLVSNAIP